MIAAVLQRPVDIGVDVGGEAEDAFRLQHFMEALKVHLRDETAFPVALLRPRIGIEKIDLVDLAFRQPIEQLRRVVIIDANVLQSLGLDDREQLCHGIDEGLDADEACGRIGAGAVNEMLTAPKADFEADLVDRQGKQRLEVGWHR